MSFESEVDEKLKNLNNHELKNTSHNHNEASSDQSLISKMMMMGIEKFASIILVEQHSLSLKFQMKMLRMIEKATFNELKMKKNHSLLKKNCLKHLRKE